MKESQFLGKLLPSHPDFLPIENSIREKYGLREVSPEEDPITEIYLGDEIVTLEEFRKDIESRVRENLSFIPPDIIKVYLSAKAFSVTQYKTEHKEELESQSEEIRNGIEASFKLTETISNLLIQIFDPMINGIVDVIYWYLFTGNSQGTPNDWISSVQTVTSMGQPMVMAMAGQQGYRSAVFPDKFLSLLHQAPAADEEGGALVQPLRRNVQDVLGAVRAAAAGLLGQEGQRDGFI